MSDQIIWFFGVAVCAIGGARIIYKLVHFIFNEWCEWFEKAYKVRENVVIIKQWFRYKDDFLKWFEDNSDEKRNISQKK